MFVPLLVLRNALRHKLRTTLTVLGIVVAIAAFGLLRTIVDAWYAGANASSSARLVTRNAGVARVLVAAHLRAEDPPGAGRRRGRAGRTGSAASTSASATSSRNSRSAARPISTCIRNSCCRRASARRSCRPRGAIAGRKLADKYGWKVGDQIPLRGTIYPGTWTFTLRGIFDGAEAGTDTSTFFFHFDYLNESIKRQFPRRGDQAGVFIEQLRDPEEAAAVSQAIDTTFSNSLAETLTETEKAFQLGFVAMSEAILLAIQAVSFVVIVIIMAVMANTMAMTARERYGEYATLKALGFGGGFVALLIFAESLASRCSAACSASRSPFRSPTRSRARSGRSCPGLLRVGAKRSCAAGGRARRRHRGGGGSGVARGARADRRRPARDRLSAHDMAIPLNYIARNLVARRLTTALTAGGMALVVYVFATVLMLAAGLEETLVATGQDDNVSSSGEARRPRCRAASTARRRASSRACPRSPSAADGQR